MLFGVLSITITKNNTILFKTQNSNEHFCIVKPHTIPLLSVKKETILSDSFYRHVLLFSLVAHSMFHHNLPISALLSPMTSCFSLLLCSQKTYLGKLDYLNLTHLLHYMPEFWQYLTLFRLRNSSF